MATKRMFSLSIIDSDMFIDLPVSAKVLYFDLAMRADDEGFVGNPKSIMRMTGAKQDDLKALLEKQFVIAFDSGVVVIRHWRIHNTLRKDRSHDTAYTFEKAQLALAENGEYELATNWQPFGNHLATEDRIGEDRIDKVRLEQDSSIVTAKRAATMEKQNRLNYLVSEYNRICTNLPSVQKMTEKRKKKAYTAMERFTDDEFITAFTKANESNFCTGKTEKSSWIADWDWFMKNDTNIVKVLEGRYDNHNKEYNMDGLLDAYSGKYKWEDGVNE